MQRRGVTKSATSPCPVDEDFGRCRGGAGSAGAPGRLGRYDVFIHSVDLLEDLAPRSRRLRRAPRPRCGMRCARGSRRWWHRGRPAARRGAAQSSTGRSARSIAAWRDRRSVAISIGVADELEPDRVAFRRPETRRRCRRVSRTRRVRPPDPRDEKPASTSSSARSTARCPGPASVQSTRPSSRGRGHTREERGAEAITTRAVPFAIAYSALARAEVTPTCGGMPR